MESNKLSYEDGVKIACDNLLRGCAINQLKTVGNNNPTNSEIEICIERIRESFCQHFGITNENNMNIQTLHIK